MKNVPNILSIIRILLIPFFVWQMLIENTLIAGIILIASGITDFLDGFLARRFNWVTSLGKVLDPIADKLTQTAISVTMILTLKSYWYIFVIIISKDLIMLILGGWLIKKGTKIDGAKWFGKVATFVFYVVIAILLFVQNLSNTTMFILLCVVAVFSVFSILMYIPDFIRYKKISQNKKL